LPPMYNCPMSANFENEIVQLHQFFQDWYNNTLAPTDENFTRVTQVLGREFFIIFPDGKIIDRQSLIASLRRAHNSHTSMRIRIKNVQIRQRVNNLILATYEEWQETEGQTTTARLSSVLFQEALSTPNGLQWLHVHETWIKS
jgi:hypothetical protein